MESTEVHHRYSLFMLIINWPVEAAFRLLFWTVVQLSKVL